MSLPIDSPHPAPARVVIIDDHQAIIEMMTQVVDSIAGLRVVGATKDAAEAVGICVREQPDILILDLVMPQVSGMSLLNELKRHCAQARVLVFSGNLRPSSIREGLAAGVLGFVEKSGPLQEFRTAILSVRAGQAYFGSLASQMVRGLVNRPEKFPSGHAELTEREKTVLSLVAQGLSSKEIAGNLGISVHTVINHRSNLMKKTGLRRVAQLSLYAAQTGLVKDMDEASKAQGLS